MSPSRRRVYLTVQLLVAAALVAAVGWQFAKLLRSPELAEHPPVVRPEFLVPAGLCYLVTHTIWATFFVQLLRSQGAAVPWLTGVRAYFVSQFGKYIPGKFAVVVLRMAMLKTDHVTVGVVGVCATYETLVSMAAGAIIGVCTLPWTGFGALIEEMVGPGVWFALVIVAGLPLVLAVLNRLAARVAAKRRGPGGRPLPSPSVMMLVRGLVQDSVGWLFLGASLWLTVEGLSPRPSNWTLDHFLGLMSAVTLSYVAGFVLLFMPGGLGAREGVLQAILARQFAPVLSAALAGPFAAVVALVLRLVWTGFEAAGALSLWVLARPAPPTPTPPADPLPTPEAAHG